MAQPQIQNIMSTFELGCRLELSYIARNCLNTEYDLKKFKRVIMRLKKPKSTALIFASGKVVVMGTTDEDNSRIAARRYANIIRKLGLPVRFLHFKIRNIVASCQLPFRPPLFNKDFLPAEKMKHVDYNPELFPGLIYRTDVTITLFRSGKIIITKGKTEQQIRETYKDFEKSLKRTV